METLNQVEKLNQAEKAENTEAAIKTLSPIKISKSKKLTIINHLRRNARKNFSCISRETGIPVTTIFDNYSKMSAKGVITKHVSLIDFKKLGYFYRSFVFVKIKDNQSVLSYFKDHPSINSVFRTGSREYMLDTIFPSIKEFHEFMEQLEQLDIAEVEPHDVIEHIKAEEFLSH